MSLRQSSRRPPTTAIVCVAAATVVAIVTTAAVGAQPAASGAATEAAKASPELVNALSKEIGVSPEQAAGAAGAIFGVAKSRLSPAEFSQVSNAVPGMDLLLKAAPTGGGTGTTGGLPQLGAVGASLPGVSSAFTKLGLSPELAANAIPVVTHFVTKSGGANVGKLLAGALK